MALHMRLMVNGRQIGYLVAQNQGPGEGRDAGDDTWKYTWQVNINGETQASPDGQLVTHRRSDGAWALVAKVIEAAGHTSLGDEAYNRGFDEGQRVAGRPCTPYFCPATGGTECCPEHSGFDVCCEVPEQHIMLGGDAGAALRAIRSNTPATEEEAP